MSRLFVRDTENKPLDTNAIHEYSYITDHMDMPCKIGARMSCQQRRKLYAVMTQLHKRLRRCSLD